MCLEWCGSNRSITYRGRASHEQSEMNLPLHNFLFPFIHHGREVVFCGIPIWLPFTWLSSFRWRPVINSLNCCIPVQFKILFTFIHRIGSRFRSLAVLSDKLPVSCEPATIISDTCTSLIGLRWMKAVGCCNGLSFKTSNKSAAIPKEIFSKVLKSSLWNL